MKRILIIACVAGVFLGAVILFLFIKNNQPDDYYPLKAGNEWKYFNKENGKNVHTTELKILKEIRATYEIMNIRSSYKDEYGFNYNIDTTYYYARKLNDGSIRSWNLKNKQIDILRLIKPYRVGTTWTDSCDGKPEMRYTVANNDTIVSVPAGVFKNCIKLIANKVKNVRKTKTNIEIFFAPNVGIIKGKADQEEVVLESYNIRK